MTKIEFTRKFLLDLDVLNVYHPENGNEDEYDYYIGMTILAAEDNCYSAKYANIFMRTLMGKSTFFDYKKPKVAKAFIQFKKEFNEKFS